MSKFFQLVLLLLSATLYYYFCTNPQSVCSFFYITYIEFHLGNFIKINNEKCKDFDRATLDHLKEIFREASAHELYFWEMAGGAD